MAAASTGRTFLVAGRRTAFGKFGGSLKNTTPVDLGVAAANGAMKAAGVAPAQLGQVICGNVITSTTDTIYAPRHVALKVGAPEDTGAYTVNRLCGSGIQAIDDARHMIERGDTPTARDAILAFGVENMSMIPHLMYGSRFGTRFGPVQTVDMLMDTLTDKHTGDPMAITAETLAEEYGISRDDVDLHALQSHNKAAAAYEAGHLPGEIEPFPLKKGVLERDEHVRYDCKMEDMASLKPAFKKGGVVTPATASGIVDGAAAVVVASEEFCNANNVTPLAEIGACAVVGVDPRRMGIGPVPAIHAILERSGLTLNDIDFVEVNEAFSAQVLAVAKALELDQSKLNVWGGAVAIGHPLGASGVRIALTNARQLQALGGRNGIAAACIGGGQGIAMHLKSVE
jgi:acetyl-CoA acyltransferase 2